MSFTSEFKEFAMRGNVIDLAVGVVIGGAFGKIVSALVASIIMPIVGLLTAGNDFSKLAVAIGTNSKGEPLLITYGAFIQSVVDFVIIAVVIFLAIRGINKLKKPPPAAAAPTTPREEVLLTEIRDLLARRRLTGTNAGRVRDAELGRDRAVSEVRVHPPRRPDRQDGGRQAR